MWLERLRRPKPTAEDERQLEHFRRASRKQQEQLHLAQLHLSKMVMDELVELRKVAAESSRDRYHDELTGELNRRGLEHAYRQMKEHRLHHRRAAEAKKPDLVMIIDLDGFKRVNDRYGHDVGDETLIDTAAVLRSSIRQDDILGRLGGDEFLIMLNSASLDDGWHVAHKMLEGQAAAASKIPTLSIGIAEIDHRQGRTLRAMYKPADVAMYGAKQAGGNQVCIFASTVVR